MAHRQGNSSNSNHDTVENNKVDLILHDWTTPAMRHLRDTVHASREDGCVSKDDGTSKDLEATRVQESVTRVGKVGAVTEDSGSVESGQKAKDEQSQDLPYDTRDHHVVPRTQERGVVIASGGDAASGTLQYERKEVGNDEEPGVEPRAQDTELGSKFNHDVFQHEIDTRRDEGRGQDQTAYLDLEALDRVRIMIHDDAANVADRLEERADGEGDPEGPCFVADALDQLDYTAKPKEGAEEGVGAEIGRVAVDGQVHGAVFGDRGAVLDGEAVGRQNPAVGGIGLRTLDHDRLRGSVRVDRTTEVSIQVTGLEREMAELVIFNRVAK